MIKNVWQYQGMISRRLLRWAGISVIAGLLMRGSGQFWKQMGGQFIAWGAIDALIAWGGTIMARERVAKLDNPGELAVRQQESQQLSRILWINAGLDVLYMLAGKWLMGRDKGDGKMKGMGWGVLIQGAFLFFFDVIHAKNMPDEEKA
jgi:hypothetical protein